jgi:penicillin amidase
MDLMAPGWTRRRGVKHAVAVLAGLLAVATIVGWALRGVREHRVARSAFPTARGEIAVAGPDARIVIDRDVRGIPHVAAENTRDGWFGLGFVHAQDRLGQMLWLRLLAQGRSAEIFGSAALESDRLARVVDFAGLAERQLEHLEPSVRRVLQAYAAGVNARMERIRIGAVGPPLAVEQAGIPLDPWTPQDSLAVFKVFSWGLGHSLDASLLLRDLIQELGAVAARPFFPGGRATEPPPRVERRADLEDERVQPARDPLRRALGMRGHSIGSSAFIVGGAHTESGRPILMADSHLEATAPPYLHVDRVRAGSLDVAGITLPGVPVFWSGRNRRIAWASVHAPAVVTDLYVETLDPSDPSRYHDGQRWQALSERVETLRVRGGDDVELRVRGTRHGPLLPDGFSEQPLSLSWVGARRQGDGGIRSLLEVARAEDADDVVAALASHREPAVLMLYVDADGEAGLQMAGWIPSRSLSAQLLPLPGRARWYDWGDRVPYEALPARRLQEGRGYLVAADSALRSLDASYSIDWLWRSGRRTKRIESLLEDAIGGGALELRGLSLLQSDVGDTRALELVGHALSLVADDAETLPVEASELAGLLSDWDGRAHADSVGASAYHVFLATLLEVLLRDQLGGPLLDRYLSLSKADPERLVYDLVSEAARPHRGRSRAAWAPVREAVRESLRESWLRLSFDLGANRRRWTWGRLHPLRFRPFGGLARVLEEDAGIGRIPYGGNGNTVSAGGYDPSRPFDARVASTVRLGFDAGALDQGLVSIAPGQSEHPGHAHFRDGVADWLEGRGGLLSSGRLLVEESSVARLVLDPVR